MDTIRRPEVRVRLGYVGAGFMAQHVHLPHFAALPWCELAVLAEARPRLARAVAARYGIPKVVSHHLEIASDPGIDAVAVSAPPAQQAEIAADLLRAGKHVFMEKPLAASARQARRVLDAAAGGARLMVGYMKRYDPGNVVARDAIRAWRSDGTMGRAVFVRTHGFCGEWRGRLDPNRTVTTDEQPPVAHVEGALPEWLPSGRAQSYLEFLKIYSHQTNLVRYLLDAGDKVEVRTVDLDTDGMTGVVVMETAGVRTVMETGSLSYHDWDEHTQVYFERGWVHAWSPPLMNPQTQARVEVYEAGPAPRCSYPVPQPAGAWAYRQEAEAFLHALQTGEPFVSSGEDSLTDVRVCEDVYRMHLSAAAVAPGALR